MKVTNDNREKIINELVNEIVNSLDEKSKQELIFDTVLKDFESFDDDELAMEYRILFGDDYEDDK